MHIRITGPDGADTLLLLHAAGTSGWMWEPVIERLGRFRCIVPDLPGHGCSADLPWTSLDGTASLLADVIAREAGERRVHVVGLSLGAYVALRLLVRHPSRVNRAVISGLNVLPFRYPRLMRLMGYLMLPLFKRDFMLRAQAKALRIPGELFDEYRRSARAMSLKSFLRIGDELMSFGLAPELARASSPTLVLAGEREQDLILRSIPEIVRALPDANGYLVPGVGHGWSGEDPDLFAQTVEAWLDERSLPFGLRPVPPN